MAGYVTQSRTQQIPRRNYGPAQLLGLGINAVRIQDPLFGVPTAYGPAWDGVATLGNLPLPEQVTTSWRTSVPEVIDRKNDPTLADSAFDFISRSADELRRHPSPFDTGHLFSTTTKKVFLSHPYVDSNPHNLIHATGIVGNPSSNARYQGPLVPYMGNLNAVGNSPFGTPEPIDLSYYGTHAISKTIPTNSVADLAVALSELYREGLPFMHGIQSISSFLSRSLNPFSRLKGFADDYLGFEFGVKPLVADVQRLAIMVRDSEKITHQFLRDSGRSVRRRYHFPLIKTHREGSLPGTYFLYPFGGDSSAMGNAFVGGTSQPMTWTIDTREMYWFSGAYTYYVPNGEDFLSKMNKYSSLASNLTGLRVTPEVLWNLAPWSWLVDWFANVGDFIHNLSAFSEDSLVMRWGYLMHDSSVTQTFHHPGVTFRGSGLHSGPISVSYQTRTKTRERANPYGFGQNPNSLSDRQWSILSALGISKGSAHSLR